MVLDPNSQPFLTYRAVKTVQCCNAAGCEVSGALVKNTVHRADVCTCHCLNRRPDGVEKSCQQFTQVFFSKRESYSTAMNHLIALICLVAFREAAGRYGRDC